MPGKGTGITGGVDRGVVVGSIGSIQGVCRIGFRLSNTEGSKSENSGLNIYIYKLNQIFIKSYKDVYKTIILGVI